MLQTWIAVMSRRHAVQGLHQHLPLLNNIWKTATSTSVCKQVDAVRLALTFASCLAANPEAFLHGEL